MPSNFRRLFAFTLSILCLAYIPISHGAEKADFAFKPDKAGFYTFNTGVLRGTLQSDDKSQGIISMVDISTGTELAYGKDNPGLLSYYRLLSPDHRYADTARDLPKTTKILADGALEITWPPAADHPFEMQAIYRWKTPDTLDLETRVKPQTELPQFEIFLSSYFNQNTKTWVYLQPPLHGSGAPSFMAANVNPLVSGTYLAFPRDRKAAQLFYDGRWDRGTHPVHFSVTKFLAAPLCMKKDSKSGIVILLMCPKQDCFAVDAPYNMDPPDGVSGHYSIYLSLLGETLTSGQTRSAHTRFIVKKELTDSAAVELYNQYLQEMK